MQSYASTSDNYGLGALDKVLADVADDVTGAIRMGLSAEKDGLSFGGNLGLSTGGARGAEATFGLNARYRFKSRAIGSEREIIYLALLNKIPLAFFVGEIFVRGFERIDQNIRSII